MEKLSHILDSGKAPRRAAGPPAKRRRRKERDPYGTGAVDDRHHGIFCAADRDLKEQGKYGASVSGTGGGGWNPHLRHESVFSDAKSGFYYCAQPAHDFDVRGLRHSGGFPAFLHSDFKHDIEISQKLFF